MPKTIRIDDEVWAWLQGQAMAFEDTPNSVLRRVAGLGSLPERLAKEHPKDSASAPYPVVNNYRTDGSGEKRIDAKILSKRWGVKVRHALYHHEGTFYEQLRRFPGALFDRNGYVVFQTEKEYRESPSLQFGVKLNVPDGIAKLKGYVRVE